MVASFAVGHNRATGSSCHPLHQLKTSGYGAAVMAEFAGRGAKWAAVPSADGFAAISSVGFEPVGQVFDAAIYPLVSCPGTTGH
jgi:hypothetical protein